MSIVKVLAASVPENTSGSILTLFLDLDEYGNVLSWPALGDEGEAFSDEHAESHSFKLWGDGVLDYGPELKTKGRHHAGEEGECRYYMLNIGSEVSLGQTVTLEGNGETRRFWITQIDDRQYEETTA